MTAQLDKQEQLGSDPEVSPQIAPGFQYAVIYIFRKNRACMARDATLFVVEANKRGVPCMRKES